VTATAGAVWFVTRRRMRRKLELLEMQHAVEYERSRIAQDIHDDLGSHLTRITMLSESARSNPAKTASDLQSIYGTARELTRAMDEIVWAVNPRHDTLEGLLSYLEKYALDFLRTAGMKCRLDFPMPLPRWQLTAEIRHNLFLAFKEALNNAAKHSHGSSVTVSFELQPAGFLLSVSDDGDGMPEAAADGSGAVAGPPSMPAAGTGKAGGRLFGGDGMNNMRRRMEKLGGQFRLHSEPGKGTRVELSVPLPRTREEAS
jgi:signal transduction histidine kinase